MRVKDIDFIRPVVVTIGLLGPASPSFAVQTYNLPADFSNTANPNGV